MAQGIKGTTPECWVGGCVRPMDAQGYCNKHYNRWREWGIPYELTSEDRFWFQLDKSSHIPTWTPFLGPCWIRRTPRTAGQLQKNYSGVTVEGQQLRAFNYVYEYVVGPIPDGLVLDHLCRNPPCVNPGHMEPVPHAENIRRGYEAKAQTHCKRGHDLSLTSRITSSGSRDCVECGKERDADPSRREATRKRARDRYAKKQQEAATAGKVSVTIE